MNFKEKQFDGPYEISEVQINNEGEILRGILYFPPEKYKKPYPIITYFHGFPQLFTLQEIIENYYYLLELGYAFFVFNFRGYRFSEGKVSLTSQVSDALKVIEFIELISKKEIFSLDNVNIIGYDIGAFIALILCSKIKLINKLLLISPILKLKKHIYNPDFVRTLNYINYFLPGNVCGIENTKKFVNLIKKELEIEDFNIKNATKNIHCNKLKIIIGDIDKLTPISEVNKILLNVKNVNIETKIIEEMDHEFILEGELKILQKEIRNFFKL